MNIQNFKVTYQILTNYNNKLMNKSKFQKFSEFPTSFLHIAIPVTTKFDSSLIT